MSRWRRAAKPSRARRRGTEPQAAAATRPMVSPAQSLKAAGSHRPSRRVRTLKGVTVLVPAHNEADCLPDLLDRLSGTDVDRVIVVDNGSTDGTARVAAERGATVVSEPVRGYGRACLAGIRELVAAEHPPQILVFVDADDFLAPSQLEGLVAPIVRDAADLVVGERRSSPGDTGVRVHAQMGNALVTGVLRRLLGSHVRDLGPFRAIRFSCLRRLELDDPDYGWYVQMQVRALRSGCRVIGLPVDFHARTVGRSKVSGSLRGSVLAGIKILRTLAGEIGSGIERRHHSA